MAKPDAVFIYIGTYPSEAAARDDYAVVKDLHAAGAVGTYDAAVVTKDDAGKVHVNKDEMATRHGAWGGAAVGAVVGILFPPSIIGTAIVGAAVGGVGGHLWRGMSRSDVKEFGETSNSGLRVTGTRRRRKTVIISAKEIEMFWIIGGSILYFVLIVTLGVMTIRKGHWVMFVIGFFLPFFWLIGAIMPSRRRAY